jgi:hypothetical protein
VVIDGDIYKVLPTRRAGLILRVAGDAVARLDDSRQLFNVDVQKVSWASVLVTNDGDLRFQHLDLIQLFQL